VGGGIYTNKGVQPIQQLQPLGPSKAYWAESLHTMGQGKDSVSLYFFSREQKANIAVP